MGSIIVALPNGDDARKISGILRSAGMEVSDICVSAADVLNVIGLCEYGMVICSAKLKDMNYLELYEYLPESFEMLLLSSKVDDAPPEIAQLPIPFHTSEICRIVSMILAQQARRYKKTKSRPKYNDEKKTAIDKSKELLMKSRKMTEPEAHRYIQKCSMDSGCDMYTTALKVLDLFQPETTPASVSGNNE